MLRGEADRRALAIRRSNAFTRYAGTAEHALARDRRAGYLIPRRRKRPRRAGGGELIIRRSDQYPRKTRIAWVGS